MAEIKGIFVDSYRERWFWTKVQKSDDGCWLWLGPRDRDGYGRAHVTGHYFKSNQRELLEDIDDVEWRTSTVIGSIRDNKRYQVLQHLVIRGLAEIRVAKVVGSRKFYEYRRTEYGLFCLQNADEPRRRSVCVQAHRLSWTIAFGTIPEEMQVLHSCDTPPCVRPDHFFLGKNLENQRDSVAKDRNARGERSGMAKLFPRDVKRIRELAETHSPAQIAPLFGVTPQNIKAIVSGRTWKHLKEAS